MENQEIIAQLEKDLKNSDNWILYHHTKDDIGNPALMLREKDTETSDFGVNINVFKGHAYLFMDNGTPDKSGDSYSVQDKHDFEALEELMEMIKPFIKEA